MPSTLGSYKVGDQLKISGGYNGSHSEWLSGDESVTGTIESFDDAAIDLLRQAGAGNPVPGQTDKVIRLILEKEHRSETHNGNGEIMRTNGKELVLLLNDRLNFSWSNGCVVLVFQKDADDTYRCIESHAECSMAS